MSHVVVLGLMGSGKTTIGRLVADRLGRDLIDGDVWLEARAGTTAAGIAAASGIEALHRLEAEVLHDALAADDAAVIAPAASIVDDDQCLDALAGHTVVWLTAPAGHLAAHAKYKDHRPLVGGDDDESLFRHQIERREPRIRPLAALVVDVTEVHLDEAVDQIVTLEAGAAPSSS